MQGAGSYSNASRPKNNAVMGATLSGTAPTSSSYTDTTYTCSGSGCKLDAGKTYFIVASYGGAGSGTYGWESHTTLSSVTETKLPSDNGWDIRWEHYYDGSNWNSWTYSNLAELIFEYAPSLTPTNVTSAGGATLTLSNYLDGDWYYKANTGSHTTCQGPVSGTSTTLSGLGGGNTYTYTAYSDSTCTTANEIATAAAFSTTPNAPGALSHSLATGTNNFVGQWNRPTGLTGSVTYEIQSANNNTNNPYGSTTTISSSDARVNHNFGTTLTVKFRVRAKITNPDGGVLRSAWAEYTT